MALASPGYSLESFSPEGSEQMRSISMVIARVSQESRFSFYITICCIKFDLDA